MCLSLCLMQRWKLGPTRVWLERLYIVCPCAGVLLCAIETSIYNFLYYTSLLYLIILFNINQFTTA